MHLRFYTASTHCGSSTPASEWLALTLKFRFCQLERRQEATYFARDRRRRPAGFWLCLGGLEIATGFFNRGDDPVLVTRLSFGSLGKTRKHPAAFPDVPGDLLRAIFGNVTEP